MHHRTPQRLTSAFAALLIAACASIAHGYADAAVYKCIIDGKTIFQDTSCPVGAGGPAK